MLSYRFKQNLSSSYCHDPAEKTQCWTSWMQIATYVPTSATKLPPLWNKSKIKFALTSLRFKVNNTLKEKLCFTWLSTRIYWNRSLAVSGFFRMFSQSIKFYIFHSHLLKSTDICKMKLTVSQKYSEIASFSKFYGKPSVSFRLNKEKCFLLEVSF